MVDVTYIEQKNRVYFSWVPEMLFFPNRAFKRIATYTTAIWITPLLILSILVICSATVEGRLKNQQAIMGEITYPPDFQYYSPDQQAQYLQAVQSTQGPLFTYVLPSTTSLIGVWFGWLILGGVIHLVSTLFGGRGSTTLSLNIVAWSSMPLALRELVQIIYMLSTKRIITNPGLSGFSPNGDSGWPLIIGQLLKFIDLYLIWEIILLIIGTRSSMGLSRTKATLGVFISIFVILLLQVGVAYITILLGNLTIVRPFFF